MPSPSPLARRRGRRLAGTIGSVLLMVLALLAGLGAAPSQSIAALASPVAGVDPSTGPGTLVPADPNPTDAVSLHLDAIDPTALTPGSTLTAQVTLTNTSAAPIASPVLELRASSTRLTARSELRDWQADTSPAANGAVRADSGADAPALGPGESRTLSVSVAADALGFSAAPELWGPRRVALTVRTGDTPLATLRTFTVWRPAGSTAAITQSVLLPLTTADPGAPVLDATGHAESVSSGALKEDIDLAERPDVDWLLDPSLLAPPALPVPSDQAGADGQTPTADATGSADGTDAAGDPSSSSDASASETPSETPTDDPSADGSATGKEATTGQFVTDPAAAALAERLRTGAADRTVLALPYADADLDSLAAARTSDLSTLIDERGRAAFSAAGITPAGRVVVLPGEEADERSITRLQDLGTDVVLTPSSSLREDPEGTITPSSTGRLSTASGTTALLAPDPVLSAQFGSLTTAEDAPATTQRLLAETAVIAGESTPAPRHVLISPAAGSPEGPGAAVALDALDQAPWIQQGRTQDLLDAAANSSWTENPQDERGAQYAIGTIGPEDVHPSTASADGRIQLPDAAVTGALLPASLLRSVQDQTERLEPLRTAMEDPTQTDAAELLLLSTTSAHWRDDPDAAEERLGQASTRIDEFLSGVRVELSSEYNLVSKSLKVPITVVNDLDSPVTVRIVATSDKDIVRLPGTGSMVTVPARGQASAEVPVEAVANGTVTMSVALETADGSALAPHSEVDLTVNPEWENWTTMGIVVLMGLLVVVGVLRARRTGSDRRAPASLGPEDPRTLAETGLSRPYRASDPRDEDA